MGGGRRFFLSLNKTDPELNRTSSYQRWDLDLVDVIKLSPNLKKMKFIESFMYQLMNYSCLAGYIHINYKNVRCLSRCWMSPIVLWRIVFLLIKGMAEAETRRKRFP